MRGAAEEKDIWHHGLRDALLTNVQIVFMLILLDNFTNIVVHYNGRIFIIS